jgi:hypothetical protein
MLEATFCCSCNHYKNEKKYSTYDLQMMTRTQIVVDKQAIVKYDLVRAMCVYSGKEMLIISHYMGNHWILLPISTMHDQVWYHDSNSPDRSRFW